MKESTKFFLEEEIKSGNYAYKSLSEIGNYLQFVEYQQSFKSIKNLFETYLALEFDDIDVFFKTFHHKDITELEFFQFVTEHIDDFKITQQILDDNSMSSPLYLLRRDIAMATNKVIAPLYIRGTLESKQPFVDTVLKIGNQGNLLEIGSSYDLPITSLLFAQKLGHISSIDKFNQCWSNLDFFKNIGINAISDFITEKTDISEFKTIASQRACHGAITVVDKLANNDGEQIYVQELCDCASPSDKDKMTHLLEYLRSKDDNLKSISIKRTPTGQKECHINGLDNDRNLFVTYITNSPKHIDDIAQIITEKYM